MNRRTFVRKLGAAALGVAAFASPRLRAAATAPLTIQTVRGPIPAATLGPTLPHEHLLVDFIGADQVSPARYDADEVFRVVLPHLEQVRGLGLRALVECTPAYLARDPRLLARLSEASGLHLLTNTGLYGARKNIFLPPYAHTETAAQLAARWTAEARDGIEGTGIRPGLIKIGVDPDPALSAVQRKLVAAGALTHLATGLTVAVHTGRGPGLEQIDVLRDHGIAPSAYIWVHAQGAADDALYAAADHGAWISCDGLSRHSLNRHLHLCRELKQRGHLGRVLLSHDAGWFDPAQPGGGTFRPFDLLSTVFLPLLRRENFTETEIEQLTVHNPAAALAVRVRAGA
jgi:predicted metal-dependent phosphotriesterase family hydrolase